MINGAKKIIDKLNNKGYEAYLVGGCVRDIIMNNIPYDYDITTSAPPEKILEIFPDNIPTGLKHGTVTVIMDNYNYEVTTYRIDGKYEDNRHPLQVTFSDNLLEDIKRRDFTINSIAYNEKEGFIDYFNGKSDIKNKIIRTVNNPYERFNEDALRILRGIRFSSKFDFKIESNTHKAMKELMNLTTKISGERIFDEINKMFSASPYSAVKLLYEMDFFKSFELSVNSDTLNALKYIHIKNFIVVFCIITYNKSNYHSFLQKLKCSNYIIKSIEKIHKSFEYNLDSKENIKQMLFDLNCNDLSDYIFEVHSVTGVDICKVKELYNSIIDNKECFSVKDLDINGNDLIKLGIEQVKIGTILDKLCRIVIKDNNLNKKEILIKKIQE